MASPSPSTSNEEYASPLQPNTLINRFKTASPSVDEQVKIKKEKEEEEIARQQVNAALGGTESSASAPIGIDSLVFDFTKVDDVKEYIGCVEKASNAEALVE